MEKENLEVDIENIKDAYDKLIQAMNDIVDVDGLDTQYQDLERIADDLDNEKINLEIVLGKIEEENEFKKNQEQWKKEIQEQNIEFEGSKI